jgi:acyl-CoA synthetase (AMP-forming)/AMP-acid ligase II
MSTPSDPRIADLVAATAGRHPDAPALIVTADRIPITYRDLLRAVDDLAVQLSQGGLLPGDRVGLRAPSSVEFVVGLLAASRAELIVVPLDPALPVTDQHARIAAAGGRVVLVDGDTTAEGGALPYWPISVAFEDAVVTAHVHTTVAPSPASAGPDGLQPDNDALIMFTGGTTGAPKMVPWTHHNVATSVGNVVASYGLGPDDATVAVMPLFHGHGLIAALLATLASGGTVLIPAGGRFSAHTFDDDLRAARATWFTAVPTIHQILLGRKDAEPERARLRFLRSCSAALNPETAHALQSTFGASVRSAYGMTEATHQMASTTEDETVTAGLVGQSTGVQVQIIGDDGRPCPPDAVGEIWVRGPTVVRGYLANPSATEQTFTDGWLHTGDLGSLSGTGELTLRGRIKELINRAGEKISPERVELVLAGHPNVLEAAVFGVPDELYGETVGAAVVPDQSTPPTTEELTEYCRGRLAGFEVPASIALTDELPHTAKGSVDRRAVAEKFAKGA